MLKTGNNEVWRDIPGYEGLYRISNHGRVMSYNRVVKVSVFGKYDSYKKVPGRLLKLQTDKSGYLYVGLVRDHTQIGYKVHRLVASVFLPNPNNLKYINHKDEDKTNNFVWVNHDGTVDVDKSNLEWCTTEYNNTYGTRVAKITAKLKIKVCQYSFDGRLVCVFDSIAQAAKAVGGSCGCISGCCRHKRGYKTHKGYIWEYEKGN